MQTNSLLLLGTKYSTKPDGNIFPFESLLLGMKGFAKPEFGVISSIKKNVSSLSAALPNRQYEMASMLFWCTTIAYCPPHYTSLRKLTPGMESN